MSLKNSTPKKSFSSKENDTSVPANKTKAKIVRKKASDNK